MRIRYRTWVPATGSLRWGLPCCWQQALPESYLGQGDLGQEVKMKQVWESGSSSPSQAGSGELARHVRGWKREVRDDDQPLEVLSF